MNLVQIYDKVTYDGEKLYIYYHYDYSTVVSPIYYAEFGIELIDSTQYITLYYNGYPDYSKGNTLFYVLSTHNYQQKYELSDYCSGGTSLYIKSDGSFSGSYSKREGYNNKTFDYCYFNGRFNNVKKISSTVYTVNIEYFNISDSQSEYTQDGYTYRPVNKVSGLDIEKPLYIYLPGTTDNDFVNIEPISWFYLINYYIVQPDNISFTPVC